jgi:hypothetical protein
MAVTLLFAVYCLEAGIFFVVAPWTAFWVQHPLLHSAPAVAAIVDNSFFRGLISGFGLAHLVVAVQEVHTYFFTRRKVR